MIEPDSQCSDLLWSNICKHSTNDHFRALDLETICAYINGCPTHLWNSILLQCKPEKRNEGYANIHLHQSNSISSWCDLFAANSYIAVSQQEIQINSYAMGLKAARRRVGGWLFQKKQTKPSSTELHCQIPQFQRNLYEWGIMTMKRSWVIIFKTNRKNYFNWARSNILWQRRQLNSLEKDSTPQSYNSFQQIASQTLKYFPKKIPLPFQLNLHLR